MPENKITWVLISSMLAITITTIYLMIETDMITSTLLGVVFVIITTMALIGIVISDSKDRKKITILTQSDYR